MNEATAIDHPQGVFEVLRSINGGNLAADLQEKLQECVQTITRDEAGKASITLKMEFAFDASIGAIKVFTDVKQKLPQPRAQANIFFSTPEGNLVRTNPYQREMFDRE